MYVTTLCDSEIHLIDKQVTYSNIQKIYFEFRV